MSLFLHQFCLAQVPQAALTQEALSALVCGKNFERLSDIQLYSSSGLIHLFVVSGSHLILIQKFLTWIKIPNHLLLFVLFIYTAICLFNPPVTRSFIFLLMIFILHQNHQYWPKHYLLLIAGLTALIFDCRWMDSLSLQMSWLAALVLEIYSQKFKTYSVFFRQFIFYSLFVVCFMGLGFPQLSTVVACVILSPVLEYVLFPLAILVVLIHPLEPLFSKLLLNLNCVLKVFEFHSVPSPSSQTEITLLNWVIIFLCHFMLFFRKPRT